MQLTPNQKDTSALIDTRLMELKKALIYNIFFKEDLSGKSDEEAQWHFQNFRDFLHRESFYFAVHLFGDLDGLIGKWTKRQVP